MLATREKNEQWKRELFAKELTKHQLTKFEKFAEAAKVGEKRRDLELKSEEKMRVISIA